MMTTPFYTTPEDAEDAFYEAVARADLDALMAIWSDDDELVCIHPTGQRVSGHAAIRESWRAIFASNPRFSVHVRGKTRWESVTLSAHSVVEILFLQEEKTAHGPMLSTHLFTRGASGWRLISRHTSPVAEGAGGGDMHTEHRHTLH